MRADTIPARLMRQVQILPNAPAYQVKQNGSWRSVSWQQYADEVRRAARSLMALGIEPGDKVAMLGFNRPEWVIFDLAAMSIGGVGVGIYTTSSAEEVQYIVHHAEAKAIVLQDRTQWNKIEAQRDNLPLLKHVVMMREAPAIADPMVMSWEEFNAKAEPVPEVDFEKRLDAIQPSSLATLIYTSGTTGPPKGVMLSHANLAWTASTLVGLVGSSGTERMLSYLPLSHIAEQMLSIHLATTVGGTVAYAESLDTVADNLREVQPTVIFGVPRIWEKFHAAISEKLLQATGVRKLLVDRTRDICSRIHQLRNRGQTPGLALNAQYFIANRLVLSKIKQALGLTHTHLCVSGAAPIAAEILEFFASLDIVIHEVYGQSEDSGPTSFNSVGKTKFGTVGTPIPGVELRIAEDGEVLVKGKNVFMGYYKDEAATAATLTDGWMHSGDLGTIDSQGFLTITGRKKEILITAGGKNIAPANIESALKNHRLISEAVVIGDRRKFLSALLTLDEENVANLFQERDLEPGPMNQIPELHAVVQEIVDEVNSHLAQVEKIKKFCILDNNFTIERGELTPTLKVKRRVVNELYSEQIEAMYANS